MAERGYMTISMESRPKKVKVKKKINKLFKHIQTENITESNELIHSGTKLISDISGLPRRNWIL